MTTPAKLLLAQVACLALIGLFLPTEPLLLLLVVSSLYVGAGWARLLHWAHGLRRRTVRAVRTVDGAPPDDRVVTLGNGLAIEVVFDVGRPPLGARIRIDDILPDGARALEGRTAAEGDGRLRLTYRLVFDHPGPFRLAGLLLRFSDPAGLFRHESFVELPLTVSVLPSWLSGQRMVPAIKSRNRLLPIGIHRHRQRGPGAELLELRDYVPGDPPRSIAWKATARRGRLITRDFESEVTIRTRLFVDVSDSMRIGAPGATPLDHAARVGSGLLSAIADGRDPIGLSLFGETIDEALPCRSGSRHVSNTIRGLCRHAGRPPESTAVDLDAPFEAAWRHASIVHADLLDGALNRPPRGLLLSLTGRGVTRAGWPRRVLELAYHGRHRRSISRRKRMATLLAALDGLGPGAVGRLCHDDDDLSRRVMAYAADNGLRVPYSVLDEAGRFRFRSPAKLERLRDQLARAMGRARDHELFLVVVDLAGLEDDLEGLVEVLGICRSRRIRVVVFAPREPVPEPLPGDPGGLVAGVYDEIYRASRARCRSLLATAQVPYLPFTDEDSVKSVFTWLSRIRRQRGIGR